MLSGMASPCILWFRRDLRLDDNLALHKALDQGGGVIPVFIWDLDEDPSVRAEGAGRWWLHRSLESLARDLKSRGSRLIFRQGDPLAQLRKLVEETGATSVTWNRLYEPASRRRDEKVGRSLKQDGIEVIPSQGGLLFEPWAIEKKGGGPYQVFTPYWRACLDQAEPARPLAAPEKLAVPTLWPQSEDLDAFGLFPQIKWYGHMEKEWVVGETGAAAELKRFIDERVKVYGEQRDFPDRKGTSRLSPYLHFGEISPRRIWHALKKTPAIQGSGAGKYLSEIGWREFAHHLIYHFPDTVDKPLRPEFEGFPWVTNRKFLKAWQRGRTGVPMVDAGMRELWATGWMHNRVRMIVASFLVKNLLISWREGAAWFWDTLVDADLANNTLGWQWTAGCGADAAPFFRIFNPVSQGQKFDPDGSYVRKWVPELRDVPDTYIHCPWMAEPLELKEWGVVLGREYPEPIVSLMETRIRALKAYDQIKQSK